MPARVALTALLVLLLLPAGAAAAPRVDKTFPLAATPGYLVQGSDGNIWVLTGTTFVRIRLSDDNVSNGFTTPSGSALKGIAATPTHLWMSYDGGVVKVPPALPGDPVNHEDHPIAQLGTARAIAHEPSDGDLWVVDETSGSVVEIGPDGLFKREIAGASLNGGTPNGRGIAAGSDGRCGGRTSDRARSRRPTRAARAARRRSTSTAARSRSQPGPRASSPSATPAPRPTRSAASPRRPAPSRRAPTRRRTPTASSSPTTARTGSPSSTRTRSAASRPTARSPTRSSSARSRAAADRQGTRRHALRRPPAGPAGRADRRGQGRGPAGPRPGPGPGDPGPGPGPEPIPPPPDTLAPSITSAALSPSRPRARRAATLNLGLSEAASLTVTIERIKAGRRRRGRCLPPTRARRRLPRCRRFVRAATVTRNGAAGANAIALPRLRAGRYRLTIVARDAAGNQSTRRLTFTVRRRA